MKYLSVPSELCNVRDFIRWGASRFRAAGLYYGHGTDNALDEAAALVLHALSLPYDLPFTYFDANLTHEERKLVFDLLAERIDTRKPLAYLTHEAYFAGHSFFVDERVLVPRSPIAELIGQGFAPWLGDVDESTCFLDLCTGSGCIAIAMALAFPGIPVDAVDLSADALDVAGINTSRHEVDDQVRLVHSDLFDNLEGRRYDLIVSNPPYVCEAERLALPGEFQAEPQMGFDGGEDGLLLVERILRQAADHLTENGVLIVEVGSSAEFLLAKYPQVPFFWPEFEHGGDGVFILTAEDLRASQSLL